jgi:hypothetical protein
MFGTFRKISVRNILKHKIYSAINIFGLVLEFSAFIIIGLFICHELSWTIERKIRAHLPYSELLQQYPSARW